MPSYTSELMGILMAVLAVNKICDFFQKTEDSVCLGCDGQSALSQVIPRSLVVNQDQPCFDIISAT
jgi:hypothetical protein